jgi:hypothetical protein
VSIATLSGNSGSSGDTGSPAPMLRTRWTALSRVRYRNPMSAMARMMTAATMRTTAIAAVIPQRSGWAPAFVRNREIEPGASA